MRFDGQKFPLGAQQELSGSLLNGKVSVLNQLMAFIIKTQAYLGLYAPQLSRTSDHSRYDCINSQVLPFEKSFCKPLYASGQKLSVLRQKMSQTPCPKGIVFKEGIMYAVSNMVLTS